MDCSFKAATLSSAVYIVNVITVHLKTLKAESIQSSVVIDITPQ